MEENTWNPEQRKAFVVALIAGRLRDIAIARGGTGDKRREWTRKEYLQKKRRCQLVNASRKANR